MTERFIAGPFVLARESGKLAPGLVTVSACLASLVPDVWTIEWARVDDEEPLAEATKFGIDSDRLPAAIRWATDHFGGGGFAWPNVFLTLSAAREFRRRFVTEEVRILQMSLAEPLVEPFLALTTSPAPPPGYAPNGTIGVHEALAQRMPLTECGEVRGFEVLGFDGAAGFDSFRCNLLEKDFESVLGVRFNAWGLLDDAEDAARCAEFANRPEVSTCAIAWHPWWITEHAL